MSERECAQEAIRVRCLNLAWRSSDLGGPTLGETVEAWRVRTRQQHEAERQKEEDPVELGDSESDSKGGVVTARQVAERESSELYEGGESEQSFRASVASLGGLHKLTRENRGTMEEVKLLVEDHNGVGHGVSKESLRELDKLVNMAKVLEEVAVSRLSSGMIIPCLTAAVASKAIKEVETQSGSCTLVLRHICRFQGYLLNQTLTFIRSALEQCRHSAPSNASLKFAIPIVLRL